MPINFAKRPLRSRFEARLLDALAPGTNRAVGHEKRAAIGLMRGTIVEIGAGTGANMAFYGPDVQLIAIEPNPHMHDRLRATAQRHGVNLEIRGLWGEQVDLDDEVADGVVSTLVLCGVNDPAQVVSQARRILKPGAPMFFMDHVVAPEGTWTRRAQSIVKRPHRWLFNGCEVDRDIETVLRSAGFKSLDVRRLDLGWMAAYARHQIIGTAHR